MSFKNWKIWLKQLPLSLKWFAILILIRPLIDQFYFLKSISPFISPLYIVGFLSPLLLGLSFLSRRFPRKYKSFIIDFNFGLWGILVGINLILLIFIKPGLGTAASAFKLLTPIILFFYFRHFVKSKVNLIGILQTVYYSAFIPAILLFYELIFNPINAEYLTDSRGGGERIQGGYADIMNYAIYISAALLIKGYFFIRNSKINQNTINQWIGLLIVVMVCFLGLSGIKQTASWTVAGFLIALFLYFRMRSIKGLFILILFIPVILFIGNKTYNDKIEPLVNKEIQVLDGEKDIERSFNGRMGRWIDYFEIWLEMPVGSNLVGVSTSGEKSAVGMTGGIVHNEFIRILFLSGILGLFLFLNFILMIFRRIRFLGRPERFLVVGALGTFVLFSISTTPLNYAPMAYYIFPIFAFAAMPKVILKKRND